MLDVAGYLRRLKLDHPGPPSFEALTAIHRAQVERIPYTTVDIQRGRPPAIEPYGSAARLVATGRGGYCFHLNGALSALLAELGYDVRWHKAKVGRHGDQSRARFDPFPDHLALTVHGLPTAANPGGRWLVDAGLGDALFEPVALRSGPVNQAGFTYGLRPSPDIADGWRFDHDPQGSFGRMDFALGPATLADFATAHTQLSTAPDSGFVTRLVAQRRHAKGYDRLVNLSLRRVNAGEAPVEQRLRTSAELRTAVSDLFEIPLDDLEPGEWDAMWQRAVAGQEEYERSLDG